jgi:hypothetical protein
MNLEVGKILRHVSLYGSDLKLLLLLSLTGMTGMESPGELGYPSRRGRISAGNSYLE